MSAEPKSREEHAVAALQWIRDWCSTPCTQSQIPGVSDFLFTATDYATSRIRCDVVGMNEPASADVVQFVLGVYDVSHQQQLANLRLHIYGKGPWVIVQSGSLLNPEDGVPSMLDSLEFDLTNLACTGSITSDVGAIMLALAEQAAFATTQATQARVQAMTTVQRAVAGAGDYGF